MSEHVADAPAERNRSLVDEALAIRQSQSPQGTRLIEATGEIDLRTAVRFGEALQAADAGWPLVVDLTRVTFFDSAGVEALIQAQRSHRAGGISLVPSSNVMRALQVAGVAEHFHGFESVTAAAHDVDATLIAWPVGV